MYDIIFIGNNESAFLKLKERFPTTKRVTINTDISDAFIEAQKKAFTKMFWVVWDDIDIDPDFNFNYKATEWDNQYVHVFLNGNQYDGVALFPKTVSVSKQELTCRFFINKKETGIKASDPVLFEKFYIKTYEDYLEAVDKSAQDMFWLVFDDIEVCDDFKFDLMFSHHNQYDRKINHVFLNGKFYDGVILASNHRLISKREFDYRFLTDKKEWDIVASSPKKFDTFYINTYQEYLEAASKSTTNMFWVVWNNCIVDPAFDFSYQVPRVDQHIPHIFKNGEYYDGICLLSKTAIVSKNEFEHRFFTNKKEIDIVASRPKPYDIVFISYFEKSADENFQTLLNRFGSTHSIYRVNGIKGIHQAHRSAAELVTSDMFWVVDADAVIEPDFNFEFPQVVSHDSYTKSIVHVWRSRNPVNNLEYGYGGVKLLPTSKTLNMDLSKPDMTTSISSSFKVMPTVSNITAFNVDPFSAWRSAFRECVKLASKIIDGQVDTETESRLDIWCATGADKPYGEYAISGAKAGRKYGQENAGNIPALALINDYEWLKSQFEQTH